jgi:hypothetical protein
MEILTVCMFRAKRTLNFKPVRQLTINITLISNRFLAFKFCDYIYDRLVLQNRGIKFNKFF